MSSAPWRNETERADYYERLYNEQLAICDRLQEDLDQVADDVLEARIEIAELYKCKFTAKDVAQNVIIAKRNAIQEFGVRLQERFENLEYRAKTRKKTVSVDEVDGLVNWALHEVSVGIIAATAKEMAGDGDGNL
jgi:hypothetical protein